MFAFLILLQMLGGAHPAPFVYKGEKGAQAVQSITSSPASSGYFKYSWPDSIAGTNAESISIDSLGNIYSACQPQGTLFMSTDGGKTWVASLTSNGDAYRSIVMGGYVLTGGTSMGSYRAPIGTENWAPVSGLPSPIWVTSYAYDPKTGIALTGTYDGAGIYRSTDLGASWLTSDVGYKSLWTDPVISTVYIDSATGFAYLSAGGTDSVGNEVGVGIWESTDNGSSWFHIGLDGHYIASLAVWNGTLYAATQGSGLFSLTGDSTWVSVPSPVNGNFGKYPWALYPTQYGLLVGYQIPSAGVYLITGSLVSSRWNYLGLYGRASYAFGIDSSGYIYVGTYASDAGGVWKSVMPIKNIALLLNQPPEITAQTPSSLDAVQIDTPYTLRVKATDLDGDSILYAWEIDGALDTSATADSMTHVFSRLAPSTKVVAIVRDPLGAADSVIWTFRVFAYPPKIISFTPLLLDSLNLGTPTLFSVSASDPYGGKLNFRWKLNGEVIDSAISDSLTYTFQQLGSHPTLTCIVRNSYGIADSVMWSFLVTGIDQNNDIPHDFSLSQNYPNPFNPATLIPYAIARPCHVTLNVYDILGRQVATLVDAERAPGRYEVTFDGTAFPSGVYFYRLEAGTYHDTKRFVLLK